MKEFTDFLTECQTAYNTCQSCINTCPNNLYCRTNGCQMGFCNSCLHYIQWEKQPSFSYGCERITYHYVLRFFNRFASEIAYAMAKYRFDSCEKINVVSLGCGPGSEIYGLIRVLRAKKLPITLDYQGYDLNDVWTNVQTISERCLMKTSHQIRFLRQDMFTDFENFDGESIDILILNYLLSDVEKFANNNSQKESFVANLANFVIMNGVDKRMIISASRRTDIPAFYSEWFYNRIRKGYVDVRNPLSYHQVSRVSLSPDVVDCIVFWSKNPQPLLKRLSELEEYMYYFQYTITGYDKSLEPFVPQKELLIDTFKELSDTIGPKRVVWRYDPILMTEKLDLDYHARCFEEIAKRLEGYADTCVISFVDLYKKTTSHLNDTQVYEPSEAEMQKLAAMMSQTARLYGITVQTCAERIDLEADGVKHGGCIDKKRIESLLGIKLMVGKDRNQREECGCVQSIDIGEYNTCVHGCKYCYATFNERMALQKRAGHDSYSSLLVGRVGVDDEVKERKMLSLMKVPDKFRIGDIVKLKHHERYRKAADIYNYQINLYKIKSIAEDGLKLDGVSELVPKDELLPVPVNGIDDRWIYYDPQVAASFLFEDDGYKGQGKDYSYYMAVLEREFDGKKSYKEEFMRKKLVYVHEIQHWLRQHVYPIDGLYVNEYKSC